MAVRDYKGLRLAESIGTQRVQAAGPISVNVRESVSGPSVADEALKAIMGAAVDVTKENFQASVQQNYLRGQRAGYAQQAFEEVNADPLMGAFAKGGYNTGVWQAQQAKTSSDLQRAIAEGKFNRVPPEDFLKVLDEHSRPLIEQITSLPTSEQARALQAHTKMEHSLVELHTKAAAKTQLDDLVGASVARGNEIATSLLQAKQSGDVQVELLQADRAVQYVNDLLTDKTLPEEVRVEAAGKYLSMLANSDVADVPDVLLNSGALDRLDFDTRRKLQAAVRESRNRTAARDNLGLYEYEATMTQRIKGAGEAVDINELRNYVDYMVQHGGKSGEWATRQYDSWQGSQNDVDTNAEVIQALTAQDVTRLTAALPAGASFQKALDIYDHHLAKMGVPEPKRVSEVLARGIAVGAMPKQTGAAISRAMTLVAASSGDAEVNPEQIATLRGVLDTVTMLEPDHPTAASTLLRSLPEDERALLSFALTNRTRMSPDEAILQAVSQFSAQGKVTGSQRAVASSALRKQAWDLVQDKVGSGWFSSMASVATGRQLEAATDWNYDVLTNAVMAEIGVVTNDPTFIGLQGRDGVTEAVVQNAFANVMDRAIPVGTPDRIGGKTATMLVLPPRMKLEHAFPGLTGDDKVVLGQHLARMNPFEGELPKGTTVGYRFDPDSHQLWAYELDAKGNPINPWEHGREGRIRQITKQERETIAKELAQSRDTSRLEERESRIGKTVKVRAGADGVQQLRIDGVNSAGLRVRETAKWREELLGFEGLRLTAYPDAGGVAVGVGRNVTGKMKPNDKITPEQAQQWFVEDTDKAMLTARRMATELGVTDDRAVLGLAGLVYQHGEQGARDFDKTLDIVRNSRMYTFMDFVKEARNSETWRNPKTRKRIDAFIERMKYHWR